MDSNVTQNCSSAPACSTSSTHRHCQWGWHVRWILLCFVVLFRPIPGVAKQIVVHSSASLEMNSAVVWQGDSSLMRCIAKPKYTGISKVLWMRRESDGTMRNMYLYNREHPTATGPYKQFTGRVSGWLNVGEGTYYLNMNRTLVSDTAEYYCIITDDNYIDKISPAKQLAVNVKHFNHSIRVNGSSESFSNCEEVTLGISSDDNEEVTITCSVNSSPKSRLNWSVMSDNHEDRTLGHSVENCSAYGSNIYTCTSTIMLKMHALMSKRTEVRCQASFHTLKHTTDACVTLVYENFLSPLSALMLAKTWWTVGIVIMAIMLAAGLVAFVISIRIRRRQENKKHKKTPSGPGVACRFEGVSKDVM